MKEYHEQVSYLDALPIKAFIHTVQTGVLHWHRDLELLLVLRGSIYVTIQNKVTKLSEGQMTILSVNEIHAVEQTSEPNYVLAVQIDTPRIASFNPEIDATQFNLSDAGENHKVYRRIRHNMCVIILEQTQRQDGHMYRIMACIQEILYLLTRYFKHGENLSIQRMKKRDRERLAHIFAFVNEHYAEHISLRELAEREELSVNHFSSFFSSKTMMRFSDYLNSVRLKKYTELLQEEPSTSLDEISYRCGFSSPQYASSIFKSSFHTTPGQYRKELLLKTNIISQSVEQSGYLPRFYAQDIRLITKFMEKADDPVVLRTQDAEKCVCDLSDIRSPYHGSSLRLTTIGRAYEGLLLPVQRALRKGREEIGFTHVRFHGIFNDEMMVVRPESSGRIRHCWLFVDTLLDALLDMGYKPFIELTFMPSLLASGPETVFTWNGNITPPRDMKLWEDLVSSFAAHLLARYGEEEVNGWYFEVWNEPDLKMLSWTGTMQDFFRFFDASARSLREHLPDARIVGPSITVQTDQRNSWTTSFARFCQGKPWKLHAFSIHCYPENLACCDLKKLSKQTVENTPLSAEEITLFSQDYVQQQVQLVRERIGGELPILVTEWNITQLPFNEINDTAYAATAILYSALQCDHAQLWLAHWTLSDFMQEQKMPSREFFGGFGLLSVSGIPKMTWWAMWALGKLYRSVVYRDDQTCITAENGAYAILNYRHPKQALAYSPMILSASESEGYQPEPLINREMLLTGIQNGVWVSTRYYFSPQRNAARLVERFAMNTSLSRDDVERLKKESEPLQTTELLTSAENALPIRSQVETCGFELILLKYRGK